MSLNSTDMLKVSDNPEWATPQYVFDQLNREFHFTLDVCADDGNHKCERYFTKEDDGLAHDWSGEIGWMNPPYGKTIGIWVKKAADSAEDSFTTIVGLVPCRTDTRWWQENVMRADEIRFVRGRLKFGKAGMGAPFANAIIVWRKRAEYPRVSTIEFKEEPRMTIAENILGELESGPKTLTHLQRKCAPASKWPDMKPKDITGVLALMVSEGSIDVQEWVVERGKFVPVYRRRRV